MSSPKTVAWLLAGLMVLGSGAAAAQKPNVVLIYSDDQGWGDVGYHGYKDVLTPNIDKLATGGVQFSQGYVCASVCGPSRAGLLTGVCQQRFGVYGNYDKGDTYEGGIRVPFVMYWPGHIPPGKTYPHPVINLDMAPTIMARCGVSEPWKGLAFDGVDLLPFITGKRPSDERPHGTLYWRRGEDYAIRKGDWKLTWNDQAGPQTIRLFNLAQDPGEWRDLSAAEPERAQELKDLFDAWDNQLAPNRAPRNPRNRNTEYGSGKRVNVAEFNARMKDRPPARRKSRKPRTLEEQLAIAKANAKKRGRSFDAEQTTRWFRAKDLNKDGVLDERELKTKAPKDWNKK